MIEIARREIAEIPCLVLRETRAAEAPVVIHYHGWTGNMGSVEAPDQVLVQLASAGSSRFRSWHDKVARRARTPDRARPWSIAPAAAPMSLSLSIEARALATASSFPRSVQNSSICRNIRNSFSRSSPSSGQ